MIGVIATMSARRAVRDRAWVVPLGVIAAAGVFIPLAGSLALGGPTKAAHDVALGLLWFGASLLAIVTGARCFADLHDGSAMLWLSRPIGRGAWVIGRFIGSVMALTVGVAAMAVVVAAVSAMIGAPPTLGWLVVAALIWAEGVLLAAWSAALSSRTGPMVGGVATIGLWLAGHLADAYADLVQRGELAPAMFAAVFAVAPDLDLFNVQVQVVHGVPVAADTIGWAFAYSSAWTVALLAATTALVQRQDIA